MEYESPWFFQCGSLNFSNMPNQDGATFGFVYLGPDTRFDLVDFDTMLNLIVRGSITKPISYERNNSSSLYEV